MAVAQVNGSAWTKANAVNNRGTILLGGNIPSGWKFKARNNIGRQEQNDSVVNVGVRNDVAKANNSGTFASMSRTAWVVMKVATTLAGISNRVLQSGAADYGERRAIPYDESDRQCYLKGFSWTANQDGMPSYSFTVQNNTASFGNDNAARVTYTVPGKSFFTLGGRPVTTAYPKKTVV